MNKEQGIMNNEQGIMNKEVVQDHAAYSSADSHIYFKIQHSLFLVRYSTGSLFDIQLAPNTDIQYICPGFYY
jgi:hypothetical protein